MDTNKKDLFVSQKVDWYLKQILTVQGWVYFNKEDCGGHRLTIFEKTKEMLKLMGIRYAIPPPHPSGAIDYGLTLKLRLVKSGESFPKAPTGQRIKQLAKKRRQGISSW